MSLHPIHISVLSHSVAVRLAGGFSEAEGRVEVYINGEWGAICGFFWDPLNSEIVCRQLGYPGLNHTYYETGIDISANRTWLLNSLFCTGSEENLLQCEHDGVGIGCPPSVDIGVICATEDLRYESE